MKKISMMLGLLCFAAGQALAGNTAGQAASGADVNGVAAASDWDHDPVGGVLDRIRDRWRNHPGANPPWGRLPVPGLVSTTVICASQNYGYRTCDSGVAVILSVGVQQLSKAPCQEGVSWGHDRANIWVTNGCRASFTVSGLRP